MTTLSDVVASIADQLARYDLDQQITKEVGFAVQKYSRKLTYLTEVRGGVILLDPQQVWYSSLNIENASGLQAMRRNVPFSNVVKINYVRTADAGAVDALLLENGGALLTDDAKLLMIEKLMTDPTHRGMFDTLAQVHYGDFENDRAYFYPWTVCGYALYGGQFGIWPDRMSRAVYVSASVKPMVPDVPDDESVFFEEARELIEAAAAKQVCAKYVMDAERAAVFGTLESTAYTDIIEETNTKASTGRIAYRW